MTVKSALQAWVVAGSGLAVDRVRWADQDDLARPTSAAGAWISLRLIGGGGDTPWVKSAANPLVVADVVESVDAAANTLTLTAHGLLTGDGPVRLTTTGTLPAGLALATDYWIIRASANAVQLAATFLQAVETPTPIDITGAGAGTHSMASTAATRRAGAEIVRSTQGTTTETLSVQCFGGGIDGAASAETILRGVAASRVLPSIVSALRADKVGISTVEGPRNVSAKIGAATFESRWVMEVRFVCPVALVTENGTVIETVVATGTVT